MEGLGKFIYYISSGTCIIMNPGGLISSHILKFSQFTFVAERTSYVWRVNYFDCWSRHIISPKGDDKSHLARMAFLGISNLVKACQTTSSSKSFGQDRRISVHSSISSNSPPWEEPSNSWTLRSTLLDPRVPTWIWIRHINSTSDNSATLFLDNL